MTNIFIISIYLALIIAGQVFHCQFADIIASYYLDLLALTYHVARYKDYIFRRRR